MHLITPTAIAAIPTSELKGLLRQVFNVLANASTGSPEHSQAKTSVEVLRKELTQRPP